MTTTTKVDYNQVKEMFDKVVTDGRWTYNVSDYKMGCDAYYLWCHEDQNFYYTDYTAFHALYEVIGDR